MVIGSKAMEHKIKTSAPGKLVLFGEHAVIYNRPAIATAINLRAFISIQPSQRWLIKAPEITGEDFIELKSDPRLKLVRDTINVFKNRFGFYEPLRIETNSYPSYGVGSSAAIVVAMLKAMLIFYDIKTSNSDLFELSYEVTRKASGITSGVDIAAAINGGTIYFHNGKIERLRPPKGLVIGFTGIKSSTSRIVAKVREDMKKRGEIYERLYDEIADIVEKAREAIQNSDIRAIGALMNHNHSLLRSTPISPLGVSSVELERLIRFSLRYSYGAKLSGAGMGDCMISLAKDENKVRESISEAGGVPLNTKIDAEGVRVEL